MSVVNVRARVREDGALEIPVEARERLRLRPGDEVQIAFAPSEGEERNPLLEIIGIGQGGPPDGAENHDKYLYGKGSQ